jgi:DNA-directed RNA polymerase subunit RPC12/RpoP
MDTTVVVVIVGVVLVLAVGGYLFMRGRSREDENYYHFRCPRCKRRLRFQAKQVGHTGRCSNCGSGVLFPPISQSVD